MVTSKHKTSKAESQAKRCNNEEKLCTEMQKSQKREKNEAQAHHQQHSTKLSETVVLPSTLNC